MNRYDRKMKHKRTQKKMFTPYRYNSFEEYCAISEEEYMYDSIMHPGWFQHITKCYNNGRKKHWERYWRGVSVWYRNTNVMKLLKEESNCDCRNYYKREISKYLRDDEYDVIVYKKFGDLWHWD